MIKTSHKKYIFKQKIVPYMFLAPNILIFSIYIIVPALVGFYYSFTLFNGRGTPEFIGIDNYIRIIRDEDFIHAAKNTLSYVAVTVPLIFYFSLGLAGLISKPFKGRWFVRASYYWPVMISAIVVGVMWQWILGDSFGLVNMLLNSIGASSIQTLVNPFFAKATIVFIKVWSRAGYYMIIFLGAILSIPPSLYEAASVDGANKWQKFKNITYPSLKPARILVLILSTMEVFKTFPLVVTLTNGGPYGATRLLVQEVYETAFEKYQYGYASAMSIAMLIVVTSFSGIVFYLSKRGEN